MNSENTTIGSPEFPSPRVKAEKYQKLQKILREYHGETDANTTQAVLTSLELLIPYFHLHGKISEPIFQEARQAMEEAREILQSVSGRERLPAFAKKLSKATRLLLEAVDSRK